MTGCYEVWQKDRTKLMIEREIGEGNFGSVCLGSLDGTAVAVKTIKVRTRLKDNIVVHDLYQR